MKTAISRVGVGTIEIAGRDVSDMVRDTSIAHLLLTMNGAPFDMRAIEMVNAMSVGFCDHGLSPPSTISARLAASCGVDLSKSLIAALACMGDTHAPVVSAMEFLGTWEDGDAIPKPAPGFGHPIHKIDPRVSPLLEMAAIRFGCDKLVFCQKAQRIERMLPVRMNYAGVAAAICLDLSISQNFAMLIAVIGRFIGLTAHYQEQLKEPCRVICYDEGTQQFSD
jgi:citrate synthase